MPYNDDGTSVVNAADTAVVAAGYTEKVEHAGSLTRHNLADSKLAIPTWDRSNVITFNANARAAYSYTAGNYYDSGNPTHWHITEIARGKMWLMTNTSYHDMHFCKVNGRSFTYFERDYLDQLFSYSIDRNGKLADILRYTGDAPQLGGVHFKVDDDTNVDDMITLDSNTRVQYGMMFNFAINSTDEADLELVAEDVMQLRGAGHIIS